MGDTDNLQKFGARVRELREQNKLTQAELAEKAGYSTNFIGMIERGERNTKVANVFRLAMALGVSLAKFFENM